MEEVGMKKGIASIFAVCFAAVVMGCGSGEDAETAAPEAATDARKAAESVVSEVAPDADEKASAQCLKLDARKAWAEALEPCIEATKEKPKDLRIQHALQRARAAAEQE
jgi:hypothetical protein